MVTGWFTRSASGCSPTRLDSAESCALRAGPDQREGEEHDGPALTRVHSQRHHTNSWGRETKSARAGWGTNNPPVLGGGRRHSPHVHRWAFRSRNAFAMTDTELNVMAALAIIGLRTRPKKGYKIPAASGTPIEL